VINLIYSYTKESVKLQARQWLKAWLREKSIKFSCTNDKLDN